MGLHPKTQIALHYTAPRQARRGAKLPAWQVERERRLHRQFLRVKAAESKGKSIRAALKQFAWYWRGETYRRDPAKRCAFGMQTLCRLYRVWRRGGEVPPALRLRYKGLVSSVPAPLACRFADFVARLQFPSMKVAWCAFSARNGWLHGRQGARPLKLTYAQIKYAFPAAWFRQLQAQLKARERAQRTLDDLRFEFTAEIRARLQDHPHGRRRTGDELSRLSSEL